MTDGARSGPRPFYRRVVRNTAATGVANGWAIVVGVASLPFVLHGLGPVTFGRWVLLQTLSASTGWLVVLDVGLGTSATTFVASRAATDDATGLGEVLGTTLGSFAGLTVLGVILISAAGWPVFARLAHVPASAVGEARLAVWLLVGQVAAELIIQGFESCLEGLQRIDLSRGADMVRRTAFGLGTALAATASHRIVPVVAAALCASVVGVIVAGAALWKCWPQNVSPRWSTERFREIARYAGVLALLRPVSAIYRLVDRMVVGAVIGPAAVALVEIANQLQSGVAALQSAASFAALPGAAWLEARRDSSTLRSMFLDGTRSTLLVGTPIAVGIAILASPGIRLWVGARYIGAAGPAALAVVALGLASAGQTGSNVLLGTGRAGRALRIDLVGMVVNVGLSIGLVWPLGVAGVFWATLISFAVTTPWYVVAVCRQLGLTPRLAVRRAILPVLLPIAAEGLALGTVTALIGSPSVKVIVGVVLGGGAFVIVASRVSFRRGELAELWHGLRGQART